MENKKQWFLPNVALASGSMDEMICFKERFAASFSQTLEEQLIS